MGRAGARNERLHSIFPSILRHTPMKTQPVPPTPFHQSSHVLQPVNQSTNQPFNQSQSHVFASGTKVIVVVRTGGGIVRVLPARVVVTVASAADTALTTLVLVLVGEMVLMSLARAAHSILTERPASFMLVQGLPQADWAVDSSGRGLGGLVGVGVGECEGEEEDVGEGVGMERGGGDVPDMVYPRPLHPG